MLNKSNAERVIESNAKTLRKARCAKGLSRHELAKKLNVSYKSIEKIENGRDKLSDERLIVILDALGISKLDFNKLKNGKKINPILRVRKVTENKQRRSYKKLITKEAKVLKTLRRLRGFSQDEASALCGYSRPAIGHIENGRITLSASRIRHIVNSYGCNFDDFEKYLRSEQVRFEIEDKCFLKIKSLGDEKLNLVVTLINNL